MAAATILGLLRVTPQSALPGMLVSKDLQAMRKLMGSPGPRMGLSRPPVLLPGTSRLSVGARLCAHVCTHRPVCTLLS